MFCLYYYKWHWCQIELLNCYITQYALYQLEWWHGDVRCTRVCWWLMANMIQSLRSTTAFSCSLSRLSSCSLQPVGWVFFFFFLLAVNPVVTMRLKYDVSILVCHVRYPSLRSCSAVNESSPLVYSNVVLWLAVCPRTFWQTSSTVSSTSSTRHLWDPCFFCSWTNSLEFTARLSEGSSCRLWTV